MEQQLCLAVNPVNTCKEQVAVEGGTTDEDKRDQHRRPSMWAMSILDSDNQLLLLDTWLGCTSAVGPDFGIP